MRAQGLPTQGCGAGAWDPSAGCFWFCSFGIREAAYSLLNGDSLTPRLIKGDGEVLEEIVTKERHREINKVGVAPLPAIHPQLCL